MNIAPRDRRTVLAHLLLLGVVFVWGTTFPLVKTALRDISPLLFNLLRMALAAAILIAWNARSLRGLTRRELIVAGIVGTLLALGYQLQTAGLARTTPTRSAFLTGLVVMLVPLLSAVPGLAVRGSPPPRVSAFAGALLAFCGVVLLTAPAQTPAGDTPPQTGPAASLFGGFHLGEWLTVGCAVAFALHLLATSRAARGISARRLGTLQIAVAALIMLLTLPLEAQLRFRPTLPVLVALGISATLATAAAFTIQSWAQEHIPATHIALIFTLEPVFAWMTSLALGERLSSRALEGAALILVGILTVELWPTSATAKPVSLEGSTL